MVAITWQWEAPLMAYCGDFNGMLCINVTDFVFRFIIRFYFCFLAVFLFVLRKIVQNVKNVTFGSSLGFRVVLLPSQIPPPSH